MIRLAHFSDIHLTARPLHWTLAEFFSKRGAAWINFRFLGRRRRFRHADEIARQLVADLRQRQPHHIVFSGDATALGFDCELRRSADILEVDSAQLAPGLAVPGNHDYCTPAAAASGNFERCFARWLTGTRIGGEIYPFAQSVGPVHLIAVNSCTGNHLPWDASGAVGPAQLDRLRQLLASLPPGPRLLVTHYPVCIATGQRENSVHGLRDLDAAVAVAAAGGVGLWLHGHRHHHYHLQNPPLAPFPVICAGSATQTGRWAYSEYAIDGTACHALVRIFDPANRRFEDGPRFDVQLRPDR